MKRASAHIQISNMKLVLFCMWFALHISEYNLTQRALCAESQAGRPCVCIECHGCVHLVSLIDIIWCVRCLRARLLCICFVIQFWVENKPLIFYSSLKFNDGIVIGKLERASYPKITISIKCRTGASVFYFNIKFDNDCVRLEWFARIPLEQTTAMKSIKYPIALWMNSFYSLVAI